MRSKNKSKNELVKAIIDAYQPETAKDVQDALKDIFGPMFEAMLLMIKVKNKLKIEEMVIFLKMLKLVWVK